MAPTSVGVRELRQNLSKHLERVKRGETLTVTDRGREVAKLVPSVPDDHPDAELARKYPGTILATRDLIEVIDEMPPIEPRSREHIEALLEDMKRDKF